MEFKIGDKIICKANDANKGRKGKILGFTGSKLHDHMQIEFDSVGERGHNGDTILYNERGEVINVGYGYHNRWNVFNSEIELEYKEEFIETSDDISTVSLDKSSSEFIKKGIIRI